MIARSVRLAQATSSTTSTLALVAFNLVPLVGVLFGGWNVATLLVLYWVENGIVGVLNVPKILLAEGASVPVVIRSAVGPRLIAAATRIPVALFFVVHYGLFWFVHGVFVMTIVNGGIGMFRDGTHAPGADGSAVLWGAVGLAISHGVSFVVNYLGRGEYRTVSPQEQAQRPYGRLVILHLAILFGGFVSLMIGSPIGAVIVLVLLKTAIDLTLHRREHDALATRGAPA